MAIATCDGFRKGSTHPTSYELTLTGGSAAVSPAMSATVMVRLNRSNDTLPWLALLPVA